MLTQSQSLIYLGQQLQSASPLNNMAFAFTFREAIDPARMQTAFAELITACDAMRMTLVDGRPEFADAVSFTLPVEDYRRERDPNQRVSDYLRGAISVPFKLSERLFDAVLFQQPEQSLLYFNQHHLITDAWGYAVQLDYLMAAYANAERPVPASFAEYLGRYATNDKTAEEWKARVANYPAPPALFGERNTEMNPRTGRLRRVMSPELTAKLRTFIARPDVRSWTPDLSIFTVLTTALFAYIYQLSGQRALTIGAPAHNRLQPVDRQTAGLFMELFPLHVEIDPDAGYLDLLNKVKAETMHFLRYAQPGASSVETSRTFNVVFNYINKAFAPAHGPEFTTEWLHPGHTEPGHHFKLQAYDFDERGQLTLTFDFNEAVLPAGGAWYAGDLFMEILEQLLVAPEVPMRKLPPPATERLNGFNHTDASYPTDVTVVDLIDEQTRKTPAAPAVSLNGRSLSYRELAMLSDRLAGELRAQGNGPGTVVPVCADRSLEMVVGLLGVLKAGAAYLPLDPAFPAERLAFLCADAGAKTVVVSEGVDRLFAGIPVRTLQPGLTSPASENLPSHPRPRPVDAMYVLYTSGSTGKPKGVINKHAGLVNRLWWMQKTFGLEAGRDAVLQKTTFTFDVSGWEFWWPLMTGARLVLAEPEGHKDNEYLRRVIAEERITTLHFVPPMLELFLLQRADLPGLKRVICSGEALTPGQVNTFREAYPHAELHNLYGPTEAAIDVTHWPAPAGNYPVAKVPIGQPITNVPIRVYAEGGRRCPVSVPGELWIGGVQVAAGYLNRPALTAEKFVDRDGERWYRTGDLVRWLPDGNLEFLGRIDTQVKLRGFRIELGEIETRLTELDGVQQATVLLKTDAKSEPALVAYVVGSATQPAPLRAALADHLPGYMVPTVYVFLDALPLLANGKIDRKALPAPVFDGSAAAGDAPQGDFEEMLHAAWAEVFQLAAVGRNVHFLDLGGHSLTAIRLVNRINEDFSLQLPANTVFRHPTIATQAVEIERTIRELMAAMDKA